METTYIYNRNELLLDLCREVNCADDFVIKLIKNLIHSGANVMYHRKSLLNEPLDNVILSVLSPDRGKLITSKIIEVINELVDKGAAVRERQLFELKKAMEDYRENEVQPIYDALKKVYDKRNKACYGI